MNILNEIEKMINMKNIVSRFDVYQNSLLRVLPQILSWKGDNVDELKDACTQIDALIVELEKSVNDIKSIIPKP